MHKRRKRGKPTTRAAPDPQTLSHPVHKYWLQRFQLFHRFDQGILLDDEGWYSATPEGIARHIAERCACETIIDGFCGAGGNAIQFAQTCRRVIAIDIDPEKIRIARNNAKVYGVEDKIEFLCGDFFLLAPTLKADVVYLAPPWGGIDYLQDSVFDVERGLPFALSTLYRHALVITPNIVLYMPKHTDAAQLALLSRLEPCSCVDLSCSRNREQSSIVSTSTTSTTSTPSSSVPITNDTRDEMSESKSSTTPVSSTTSATDPAAAAATASPSSASSSHSTVIDDLEQRYDIYHFSHALSPSSSASTSASISTSASTSALTSASTSAPTSASVSHGVSHPTHLHWDLPPPPLRDVCSSYDSTTSCSFAFVDPRVVVWGNKYVPLAPLRTDLVSACRNEHPGLVRVFKKRRTVEESGTALDNLSYQIAKDSSTDMAPPVSCSTSEAASSSLSSSSLSTSSSTFSSSSSSSSSFSSVSTGSARDPSLCNAVLDIGVRASYQAWVWLWRHANCLEEHASTLSESMDWPRATLESVKELTKRSQQHHIHRKRKFCHVDASLPCTSTVANSCTSTTTTASSSPSSSSTSTSTATSSSVPVSDAHSPMVRESIAPLRPEAVIAACVDGRSIAKVFKDDGKYFDHNLITWPAFLRALDRSRYLQDMHSLYYHYSLRGMQHELLARAGIVGKAGKPSKKTRERMSRAQREELEKEEQAGSDHAAGEEGGGGGGGEMGEGSKVYNGSGGGNENDEGDVDMVVTFDNTGGVTLRPAAEVKTKERKVNNLSRWNNDEFCDGDDADGGNGYDNGGDDAGKGDDDDDGGQSRVEKRALSGRECATDAQESHNKVEMNINNAASAASPFAESASSSSSSLTSSSSSSSVSTSVSLAHVAPRRNVHSALPQSLLESWLCPSPQGLHLPMDVLKSIVQRGNVAEEHSQQQLHQEGGFGQLEQRPQQLAAKGDKEAGEATGTDNGEFKQENDKAVEMGTSSHNSFNSAQEPSLCQSSSRLVNTSAPRDLRVCEVEAAAFNGYTKALVAYYGALVRVPLRER